MAAFASGVPPDIYEFHRYTRNSTILSSIQDLQFRLHVPGLSPGISQSTYKPAYARFTPSNSEQRLHPSYYRGCWHEVSRCFFFWYRQIARLLTASTLLPSRKSFTTQGPSSLTRRCCVRLSPIAQNSPLLPPVGVWTVSQFQCG